MKQLLLLLIAAICFFAGVLFGKHKYDIYPQYPAITRIAMPNYYRKITGYDSIELIRNYDEKSVWANFCYPNQWEFEKFRKDSATSMTIPNSTIITGGGSGIAIKRNNDTIYTDSLIIH